MKLSAQTQTNRQTDRPGHREASLPLKIQELRAQEEDGGGKGKRAKEALREEEKDMKREAREEREGGRNWEGNSIKGEEKIG